MVWGAGRRAGALHRLPVATPVVAIGAGAAAQSSTERHEMR